MQSGPKYILAIDLSSKSGWATFCDGLPTKWGTLFPDKTVSDFGLYPMNYVLCAEHHIQRLYDQVIYPFLLEVAEDRWAPVEVVIEETNASRSAYSQKQLEFLHFCLIKKLAECNIAPKYVRTGVWRSLVNARQSNEEKRLNAKIARIKKQTGKKLAKIDGKVVGKKGRKHVALRVVNEIFGIDLPRKMEDAADAILLGMGFLRGAPACDGTVHGGKLPKKQEAA